MQMSTTHSSLDQYCISHKTISHRAAAAPGPKVCRECPLTWFPALSLLTTNLGDATGCVDRATANGGFVCVSVCLYVRHTRQLRLIQDIETYFAPYDTAMFLVSWSYISWSWIYGFASNKYVAASANL